MPKDFDELDIENSISLDEILNDVRDIEEDAEDISIEDILAEFGSKNPDDCKVEPIIPADAWQQLENDKKNFVAEVEIKPQKESVTESPKKQQSNVSKPQIRVQKAAENEVGFDDIDESFFDPIYIPRPNMEPKPINKEIQSSEVEREAQPKRQEPITPVEPEAHQKKQAMHHPHIEDTLNMSEWFDGEKDFEGKVLEQENEPELPGEYVKRNAMHVRRIGIRSIIAFLLCIPVCYLSFAELSNLPLPSLLSKASQPLLFLLLLTAFQVIVMLMHLDIIGHGLKKLCTLRADMLSVVTVSVLASLAHAVNTIVNEGARQAIPFCAVSCVTLFFTGLGLYLRESARLRACKAASASKSPMGVFLSERDDMVNIIKHPVEECEFFTKYVQITDGADRFWKYLAPIVIVASIVFASVSSFGAGDPSRFLWAFATITSVSAPFFVMLCYSLPFSRITKKLFSLGAAIAGWYAAFSLSGDRNVIVRDNDLFPKGSVTLHGIKVFNNHSLEKTVSYATSILNEAGCSLGSIFAELLKTQYGKCEHVYHLMQHESGGMEADICGDHVLIGTASFMLRMGIHVTGTKNVKNALYVAINTQLAGVFNLNYRVSEDVRTSIISIIRRRIIPIMAVIDCNQTPVMVETELKLRPGCLEYPNIEDRLELASEKQNLEYDPCALVMRSGMTPFASTILAARRLRKSTVRNVVLSTACAVIGMLLTFYITFVGSYASGTPYNVFLYLGLWTIPVYLLSIRSSM